MCAMNSMKFILWKCYQNASSTVLCRAAAAAKAAQPLVAQQVIQGWRSPLISLTWPCEAGLPAGEYRRSRAGRSMAGQGYRSLPSCFAWTVYWVEWRCWWKQSCGQRTSTFAAETGKRNEIRDFNDGGGCFCISLGIHNMLLFYGQASWCDQTLYMAVRVHHTRVVASRFRQKRSIQH